MNKQIRGELNWFDWGYVDVVGIAWFFEWFYLMTMWIVQATAQFNGSNGWSSLHCSEFPLKFWRKQTHDESSKINRQTLRNNSTFPSLVLCVSEITQTYRSPSKRRDTTYIGYHAHTVTQHTRCASHITWQYWQLPAVCVPLGWVLS